MKRKVKLTTRHGLHWTLDKGVRVALQALTHKARATFDGFAAGRKPGLPDTGQMSAEQIIENLRAVESMAGSLASQMETNLRMNRWREHLGDDPLDGFGGRGPAEYHYMATHEPEGPGLTRFGNLQLGEEAPVDPALYRQCEDSGHPPISRDQGCNCGFRPAPPRGEGDDLAARLEARAEMWERKGGLGANIAAGAYRQAAEMARASTHPEQWVSGDDREWLLWITSYVLNRHEFTDSAATDARAALTRIATAIKQPASPTPTEQGEDRTRVEWHDGIEHGDELALRQLAADIGCGIPYGCQPSVGKWYAAALDRVLDRLLPLDPAPEQGEARVDLNEFGRWTIKAEETEGGYRNVVLGDPLPEGASIEVIEVAALAAPTPTKQGEATPDGSSTEGGALAELISAAGMAYTHGLEHNINCDLGGHGCDCGATRTEQRLCDAIDAFNPAQTEQGEARFAADPAPPRGEGDDLAARTVQIIRNRAKIAREQGTTEAQIIRARALDEAANEFADILPALRASTHPEQSARVEAMQKALLWYADPDHWLDGQAGEWIVEEGNHVSGDGFAHNEFEHDNGERARAALEPAPPTPTEQGEARVECPSCGSNHPRRKKRVQHSPGRPFASKWCDDDFHEPAPEGEGEARVEEDVYEKAARRIVASGTTDQPAPGGEGEAS